MTKTYLFRPYVGCSGDGCAISELVRYKEEIQKATGRHPVMIGMSYYPLFGIVRGIKYILEEGYTYP